MKRTPVTFDLATIEAQTPSLCLYGRPGLFGFGLPGSWFRDVGVRWGRDALSVAVSL